MNIVVIKVIIIKKQIGILKNYDCLKTKCFINSTKTTINTVLE